MVQLNFHENLLNIRSSSDKQIKRAPTSRYLTLDVGISFERLSGSVNQARILDFTYSNMSLIQGLFLMIQTFLKVIFETMRSIIQIVKV